MKIPILYEDKECLIVNKPAGLVVHADGKTDEQTLTDWILKNYPKIKGVGEPQKVSTGEVIDRPGIVHRIDRDTSGIVVIAKTQPAFLFLKELFQERKVSKTYHAFVYGKIKVKEGVIDRPISRSKNDFRLWTAQGQGRGEARDAVTEFTVLAFDEVVTYLEVRPKTGRTHQIRVHLKAFHHPIVCDVLYAPGMPSELGFKRLALHAYQISFQNKAGKTIEAEAPFPADFKKARKLIDM